KTAIAILMGVLAGYRLRDIKRGIQHGQPQMTIADLLGNPLPSSLVAAKSMDEVAVSWRKWLGMKVKIIDEYNRIPTRTQSALLTVMADNYAEIYDHIYECPEAAWYLTANDDAGGGTYQVIEALRDRIDVTVASLHFNTRFLGELLLRVEDDFRPEEIAPKEIVFTEKELDRINERIREVEIPLTVRRRLEFFAANFEFLEPAAQRLEYMTKDTCKLAGEDPAQLLAGETGRDKLADLGGQSMNGLSVRALMTLLLFTKAMAFFRGHHEAELEDLRQVMPFVLYDKLVQNQDHPSLDTDETKALRTDRISWVRVLFDKACREYDRQNLDTDDPVAEVAAAFEKGLAGLGEKEVRKRMADITAKLAEWSQGRKLHGPLLDDVLALKYYHQRYQNYLRWLLNR
ncbi:MAG: ATPase, partial [Desulfovibrio sp.]